MSIPGSASPLFLASTAAAGAYDIPRSLRFNSGDSAYLNRTPSSAGNRKTWTWSGWVKITDFSQTGVLFFAGTNSDNRTELYYNSSDNKIYFLTKVGGFTEGQVTTDGVLRDPSAWYHIVFALDTTASPDANRALIYINGVEQSTASPNVTNTEHSINNTVAHYIGRGLSGSYFNGYLADVHLIDGQALAPTDFGEYDDNNVWQAIEYAGTYGTNGFKLNFSDTSSNSALGTDSSGAGNNFSVNNLSVAAGAGNDALRDSPVNGDSANDTGAGGELSGNYATLNPLHVSHSTLTNGNLDASGSGDLPTIIPGSGQWYYEIGSTGYNWDGTAANFTSAAGSYNFGQRPFSGTPNSGYKALCTANLPEPTIADGSTAFDTKLYTGNAGTQAIGNLNFSPDLTWIKTRSGSGDHHLFDVVRGVNKSLHSNSSSATETTTAGLTAFNSNGFSIGNSNNDINGNGITFASWNWDAGENSNKTYAVTVSNPGSGNKFYADGALQPTLTLAEGSTYKFDQSSGTNSTHPLRFSTTSDGTHGGGSEYTTGVTTSGTPGSAGAYTQIVIAASAPTLYAYCTAHSGMGFQINTSDTAGYTIPVGSVSSGVPSISSRIQANPSAGFSIVTWTGTANATVAHGLNAAPQLVLTKSSQYATAWRIWSASLSNLTDKYLGFDSAAEGTFGAYWGAMTSTTLGFPSVDLDNNYGAMVAYCFAPVEGYSAFGSYTGNGSADGPMVYTGFRPAFILTKGIDDAEDWYIRDTARSPHNEVDKSLRPNDYGSEYSGRKIDILSNGFKLRDSDSQINQSGKSYLYYAVAEHPFKTARAR
tara:strand:- start:142 stop:2598 length:2457 start_codon:yes stop_codon:yes gene_type:complete